VSLFGRSVVATTSECLLFRPHQRGVSDGETDVCYFPHS